MSVKKQISVMLNSFQHLHLVSFYKAVEILKPIDQTPYYNPTGRGQAVRAAIQDDNGIKGDFYATKK